MTVHVIYKTVNNVNGMIYIGAHRTNNINDSYMGSGKLLKLAIQKHGKYNFTKEILYVFDDINDCYAKEAELVNDDFVKRTDTYNLTVGGYHGPRMTKENHPLYGIKRPDSRKRMIDNNPSKLEHVKDMLGNTKVVKLHDGTNKRVHKNNNEHEHINKGKLTVRDADNNVFHVSKDDPRYVNGEVVHLSKNMFIAKDKAGNTYRIRKDDPRYISGELIPYSKLNFTAKDEYGNIYTITKYDPRYITGELIKVTKGTVLTCPYCNMSSTHTGAMKRRHFDKCKIKENKN